jgi:hypothetical protein
MDRHSGWPFEVVTKCGYFAVAQSRPLKGDILRETTYGTPVQGQPGFVHTYTVACNLSGEVKATWGNGSTSYFRGFTYGPNLAEQSDPTIIPRGRVQYEALTDGVNFVCLTPRRKGLLDQVAYYGSAEVPMPDDSYIVVLRGRVTIEGNAIERLGAYHNEQGKTVQVESSPQAFYVKVSRRT